MGNDQSEQSVPSTKGSSSLGKPDPRKIFLKDIKKKCSNGHKKGEEFPSWARDYDFNTWIRGDSWKGHTSVAIHCVDESQQHQYLTMHLYVTSDKIHPKAKFISKEDAKQEIKSKKMSQCFKVEDIAMRQFVKLALDLIEHHGKYSSVSNSCQSFAGAFRGLCREHNDFVKKSKPLLLNLNQMSRKMGMHKDKFIGTAIKTSAIGGGITGAVGGALAGVAYGAAAGPIGAVVGSIGGGIIGGVTGGNASIIPVVFTAYGIAASNKSNGNDYGNVDNTEKQQSMDEEDWSNWEVKIYQLQNN